MNKYYPINLNLEKKGCLVIGGGPVAERKVKGLLLCGALITVISPKVTAFLKKLAVNRKIILKKRGVSLRDIKGAFLVICAAGDRKANNLVSSFCRKKNILVNVVDSPAECSFILPAVMRRGDLAISVSTSGISPALAKKIRLALEKQFGAKYAKLLRKLKELRPTALKKIKNTMARKKFFKAIIKKSNV